MKGSICLCSKWCIFTVILPGSCWSPLKMTVIENMLLWKRHASALFWSSSFSTSASPHSDLFSCRPLTGFGLESSGKGAFSYWGRLWIVLSHLWRKQDRIGHYVFVMSPKLNIDYCKNEGLKFTLEDLLHFKKWEEDSRYASVVCKNNCVKQTSERHVLCFGNYNSVTDKS